MQRHILAAPVKSCCVDLKEMEYLEADEKKNFSSVTTSKSGALENGLDDHHRASLRDECCLDFQNTISTSEEITNNGGQSEGARDGQMMGTGSWPGKQLRKSEMCPLCPVSQTLDLGGKTAWRQNKINLKNGFLNGLSLLKRNLNSLLLLLDPRTKSMRKCDQTSSQLLNFKHERGPVRRGFTTIMARTRCISGHRFCRNLLEFYFVGISINNSWSGATFPSLCRLDMHLRWHVKCEVAASPAGI